jgi:hypothetical protein
MTDKISVLTLRQTRVSTLFTKSILAALLTVSVFAQPTYAIDQQWWFDVEVILFERNIEMANLSEKFKQSRVEEPASNALDLLTPYLKPDLSYLRAGLPYCRASNRLKVQTQYEQDFSFSLQAVKKNESYSPQTDDQLKQTPQTKQVLTLDPDNIAEDNFQFQDASTDKIVKLDETLSLAQTTDNEDIKSAGIKSTAKSFLISPSIQVEFIEWQMPSEFLCAYAEQIDPSFASIVWLQDEVSSTSPMNKIKRVPKIINGNEWQRNRGPFLLPTSTMYMTELYEKIKKQRDITPILHINWRQEVTFGREDAQTFRLFAGENLAEKFNANALPVMNDTDSLFNTLNQPAKELFLPEQELAGLTPEQQEGLPSINGTAPDAVSEDLFAKISSALIDDTPINFLKTEWLTEQQSTKTVPSTIKELWRLDGGITVYLRNVGRVPYLHIDSNLDIRQPIYDPNKTQKTEELSANLLGQDAVVINPLQQPNFLQSVNFNQLRRVISKQVHYFDHPLFGMIVRINRHRWPEPELELEVEVEVEVEVETDIINSRL